MIERFATKYIKMLSEQFPAVLILGPRQCGKTTLAKFFLDGEYFDLEKPSDFQVFDNNIETALSRFSMPLIIDEAQTLPGLFPVLRSAIDEQRHLTGRYYLLGSVNPVLIKHIDESLAGRVGIVELTPFLFAEAEPLHAELPLFWLRGGYPDALAARTESSWHLWHENYNLTFVERDIPRQGSKMSSLQVRRLMGMLAGHHGGLLNASELGRSLGISYHTVNDYLDILEGHYLIRRLPPYYPNVRKRLVKSPRVYIRDSGMLHYLLGITAERKLLESAKRGSSFEGMMIEQIIASEQLSRPGSRFYFYRTHAGAEVDLVVDRGSERLGFEFKCSASAGPEDWANLKSSIGEHIIDRGYVICTGNRSYPASDTITVLAAEKFLAERCVAD